MSFPMGIDYVERYMTTLTCKPYLTEVVWICPLNVFRPTHFRTTVTAKHESFIEGIYVCGENQLVTSEPADAWFWSLEHHEQIRQEFYKEHGLIGKTTNEIQEFLDETGFEITDPGRIDLPHVRKAETIRVTGKFAQEFYITIFGNGIP